MNEKTMTLTRMEAPAQLPVRKRVAAYARVSMEKDAMLHSWRRRSAITANGSSETRNGNTQGYSRILV